MHPKKGQRFLGPFSFLLNCHPDCVTLKSNFCNFATSPSWRSYQIEAKLSELEEKSFSTHLWGHRYRMHHIPFDFAEFNSSQLVSVWCQRLRNIH